MLFRLVSMYIFVQICLPGRGKVILAVYVCPTFPRWVYSWFVPVCSPVNCIACHVGLDICIVTIRLIHTWCSSRPATASFLGSKKQEAPTVSCPSHGKQYGSQESIQRLGIHHELPCLRKIHLSLLIQEQYAGGSKASSSAISG